MRKKSIARYFVRSYMFEKKLKKRLANKKNGSIGIDNVFYANICKSYYLTTAHG